MPYQFDQAAAFVRPDELDVGIRVSADLERHTAWLQDDIELGFDHIFVHNVNREQQTFIEAFGERVLPSLQSSR